MNSSELSEIIGGKKNDHTMLIVIVILLSCCCYICSISSSIGAYFMMKDNSDTDIVDGNSNSGGDNSGGDNSGGDNSGGDNSGGDNSGGDYIEGSDSRGSDSGGSDSRGSDSGGDDSGNCIPYQQGDVCWAYFRDTDYSGNDIHHYTDKNPNECKTACDSNSSCKGYTVNNAGTDCWIKSEMKNSQPNSPDRNSYLKGTYDTSINKCIITHPNTDYSGNDIHHYTDKNPNECKTACDSNSSCKGYTVNNAGTDCWIKSEMKNSQPNSPDRNSYVIKSLGGTLLSLCKNFN